MILLEISVSEAMILTVSPHSPRTVSDGGLCRYHTIMIMLSEITTSEFVKRLKLSVSCIKLPIGVNPITLRRTLMLEDRSLYILN